MKKNIKRFLIILIFVVMFGINNIVYGTGRFVDIPVPPNSSGYADFSSEDAQKSKSEYEKKQENSNNSSEDSIVKSGNNYLKKLEVKGYILEPEFNKQKNDYTVDLQNNGETATINIIAEAEDDKSQVNGNGTVEIKKGQDVININVIAENGNLNVYTIKIKNTEKKEKQSSIDSEEKIENENKQYNNDKGNIEDNGNNTIFVGIVIGVIVIIIIFLLRNKKRGKH